MNDEIKNKLRILAKKIKAAGLIISKDYVAKDYTVHKSKLGSIIVTSDGGYEAIYIGNLEGKSTDGFMCLYTNSTPKRNSFPSQTEIQELLFKVMIKERLEEGEGKAGYHNWKEFGGMEKQLNYFSNIVKESAGINE